jgi:Baseplate J-like protein
MLNVDDQPETIHLYVVREEAPRPRLFPIFLSILALLVLAALCTLFPYQQPVVPMTLRIPAVPLYLKDFQASVQIVPTGVKTYPATTAHGTLTLTNGSIISQTIPQGFRLGSIVTDSAVFVPAGSANGYGFARVQAHSLMSGTRGNIPAYSIDTVIGTSVYIRNLSAFYGGRDEYSVKFVTLQDKQTALLTARNLLAAKPVGLHYPCTEDHFTDIGNMIATWHCQFLTYITPSYLHVLSVKLSGKYLNVSGWFIPPMEHCWVK